ncbi:MAG: hypothetical protein QME14_07435 [Methanobacteriaceae archaeon]|nr:hypothetical protein [Methanobacteriaceae archaeon]
MDKKYIIIVIGALIAIIGVGGYLAYQESQSQIYNNLLKKADYAWMDAKASFIQVDMENGTSKNNIQYINDSITFTDQAINHTREMVKIAPDNATKEFAMIRLEQYQESKKVMGYYLEIFITLEKKGFDEAIKTATQLENKLNSSTQKLNTLQNNLIELVNSNPSLKTRLINNLGKERVNEMLQKPGQTAAG